MEDSETSPDIRQCQVPVLASRDPSQTFVETAPLSVRSAAMAQDAIGWLNTLEGKISTQWRGIQWAYLQHQGSQQTVHTWAEGLVTQLLALTHAQWKHRNVVVHERDAQGLKIQVGRDLRAAIEAQFELGVDGLHARDTHYIMRGMHQVLALPAENKQAWLRGVIIARETYAASEAREIEGMQKVLRRWLVKEYLGRWTFLMVLWTRTLT